MHARMVTGSFASEQLDEAIQLWLEFVAPSARQQKGFKSARLMVDRQTGNVASLGLWETEADAQGSVSWNEGQLTRFMSLFTAPPSVSLFEVATEVFV